MAAIALSVPLARMTSSKTTIAIKDHQRNNAANKRRASSSSSATGSARPSFTSDSIRAQSFSSPVFGMTPIAVTPQPVPVFAESTESLVVPSTEEPLQAVSQDCSSSSSPSSSSSESKRPKWKFKLLPEELLHFNPSKDPRLLAL